MKDYYPKFLPQWTKAVEHYIKNKQVDVRVDESDVVKTYKKTYQLSWTSGTCCLTGEAFFHSYAPESCQFCYHATYYSAPVLDNLKHFYKYKNDLAKHLQKDHPEIWEQWAEKL